MWTLFTLLVLVGLIVYVMFFWWPDEAATTAPSPQQSATGRNPACQSQAQAACLEVDKPWYGLTFRGFHDDYCVSTTRAADDVMQLVRVFYSSRNAEILLEDGHRLLFSRGKRIYKYLGGSDTWPTQEIEVAAQTKEVPTKISIQYRVAGWHLRSPPNQLRREVLELRRQLAGAVQ